ncbi:MAG: alpha/beta hydrolase [Bacteroidota bacterium]
MMPIKDTDNIKRTFNNNGVHISYEIHGNGNSSIVFLHGFGASVETWRDIQSKLAKNNTLFFLDLKGFGLSSKPDDGKYSLADQADVVIAFLEAQNLHNITLVGHSYGGAVSLFTYLKDQSSQSNSYIQRLILFDAAAYVQKFPFFVGILRKPIINWVVMNLIPAQIRASFTLRHLFYDKNKLSQERINRYAAFFNQPGSYNSFVECARQIIPKDSESVSDLIRTISVPTLILWGANDPAIPVEHGYRLKKDIQNSTIKIIQQCGHIPHEECPQESLEAILSFLGE